MKYYDPTHNRLIFIQEQATPGFWDKRWKDTLLKPLYNSSKNSWVVIETRKYLSRGSTLLEGGCGTGQYVYGLHKAGYAAIGIDFAEDTVKTIKNAYPNLDIRIGDVRKLEFSHNTFDGYWSLGVIEHFFEGYEQIADEIKRVVRPGGYMFLTFPYMSPLRKCKARFGMYKVFKNCHQTPEGFYQYALDYQSVIKEFEPRGFTVISVGHLDALKGLKDEIELFKPVLQALYDYNGRSVIIHGVRLLCENIFRPISSHICYIVFQKSRGQ
jgi:2-polyprenyl-3-methyl-5-hydroxy-6-metoxy-1,4-benzoquinol methylase